MGSSSAALRRRSRLSLVAAVAAALAAPLGARPTSAQTPASLQPPSFDVDTLVSDNGVVQLSWDDTAAGYEVVIDGTDMKARTVYSGHMPSAHVSGLPDGQYTARVRAKRAEGAWTDWSRPAQIAVTHHPLSLVWLLLALGGSTFGATVLVLLHSARQPAA